MYPQMQALVEAVRELDRVRAEGGSAGDVGTAVLKTELACLSLVTSTEMMARRDQFRTELIVESYKQEQTRRGDS